ncbi:MAG TPA: Pvc16 family protein, partial [Herpetosiphonaceae bacterium]
MSNFLAIATVTTVLSQMLQGAIQVDVPGAAVRNVRPDRDVPSMGLNIYLYQVGYNSAWRNTDLPTRSGNAALVQRPRVALDLHYLLTFYGSEATLEPQRVLGSTVRTLHAHPLLSRSQIAAVIDDLVTADPDHYLRRSNLADQIDLVRFTPLPLSLEELSKIWSVFFQTQYALSIAYQCSVVLIEAEETPRSALPVRERQIFVVPMRQVRIDAVEPQMITFAPAATIELRGSGLLDDDTVVQFGTIEQAPETGSTPTRLVVELPNGLRAGVNAVQVIHRLPLGAAEPRARRSMASNVAAFVLRPRLNSANFSGGTEPRITVDVQPRVGLRQQETLLLHQVVAPPNQPLTYTLTPRPRDAESDPLIFDAAGEDDGTSLVRLRVDGAESELEQVTDDTQPNY